MTATTLANILRQALTDYPDGGLCIGFSGGPDSSALLHALASLPEARARSLRAVHVDHGLHPRSQAWAAHCRTFCERLDVPIQIACVQVDTHTGTGLEAAARDARYAALAAALQPGEALLTAHHRDDQAETVLLKLLRGAGPEGLGGMHLRRPFAQGWLWRPLLDTPHRTLTDYVRDHAITSIHDSSNDSPAFARNTLRIDILPRLQGHWPHAAQAISHSAQLNQQTADFIHGHGAQALAALRQPDNSLAARDWLALHAALRGPVLEQWLRAQGLTMPSIAQRNQLESQIRHAAADRVPQIDWPGTTVHLWRDRLHAHATLPNVLTIWTSQWQGETLHLPAGAGTLQLVDTDTPHAATAPALEVRLGEIGIHLRPAGDQHTRALRDLFQQAGMPPWRRRRCPLIYTDSGTLLAVADRWQTDAGKQLFDSLGQHPRWHPD